MKNIGKLVVITLLVFGIAYAVIYALNIVTEEPGKAPTTTAAVTAQTQTETDPTKKPTAQVTAKKDADVVRISLDEWIGWKSLIDANGGLTTAKGSIFDTLGINVEFVIINDPTTSSTDLINGNLAGAGYTINRYAFLQDRFENAGADVVMAFITNYSNGGDGIIANESIQSVNDLVGARIAVPRFSEAQTLVEWLLRNSGLSKEDQEQARAGIVYFETAEDAGKAFFSGQVDAAATWEPYLTQARTSTDAHVLFDTSMSSNLILDGIVFHKEFMDENEAFMINFIKGALQAMDMYQTEFDTVRVLPMLEFETDAGILEMTEGARLATWADNRDLLSDTAISVYAQMADIWVTLGEEADSAKAESAFTDKYILALSGDFDAANSKSGFDAQTKASALKTNNTEALMSVTLDIQFEVDSYKISSASYPLLNDFAQTAKILDGVYIQIEGNTAPVAVGDGVDFSYKRALSVAKYLQLFGVSPDRIIVVGNGDTKPIADNATEDGRAANRRTEVFFKRVQGY